MIVFGPVPSRRLGKSLGINNIPPKVCSYSCVYCQLGETKKLQAERRKFYKVKKIIREIKKKIEQRKEKREVIDFLTFVPDGEPTLDLNIGQEIKSLKDLDIKIAVITNGSQLWRENVRKSLYDVDYVSVKIDAINEDIWRKINQPHNSLDHDILLNGIKDFSEVFKGKLVTETMLIKNINDGKNEVRRIGSFISSLKSSESFLSIPIRPPAENWVKIPSGKIINQAYQIFKEKGLSVKCLTEYEEDDFTSTGNIEDDLLSIMSVHPMRRESIEKILKKRNADWKKVKKLLDKGKIVKVDYGKEEFYLRDFSKR